ncbi:MAG: LptF/LptG family permease [Bacteroidota bacterium]|nr:LptF/LptG family permease [Ferruginibacter sp.]
MKKIDSYILKRYLTTFFFCLLLFTVIVVVIDISEKTDDFVKSKLPVSRIITDYYFGLVPRIDAMLFPLFVFIAVIFFTAKMADKSEVIAILASGVSFRRFLLPYWIGSIFLSSMLWLIYQFVLPRANAIWGTFEAKYVDYYSPTDPRSFPQNYYFRIDSNTYAGIKYYDTSSKAGGNFFIQQFAHNTLKYNLRADNIIWDTASRKWRLNTVMERTFTGNKETAVHSDMKLMNYNFKPVDLRKDEYLKDRLPTPELKQLIAKEEMRGSEGINALLVERYNRDAIPVSVIILSMIGATISSRKVRGGSGFHLAVGVVLSVLYILFGRFALVFATKGNFTPVLAAWVPNIIFGLLAYYFYRRAAR